MCNVNHTGTFLLVWNEFVNNESCEKQTISTVVSQKPHYLPASKQLINKKLKKLAFLWDKQVLMPVQLTGFLDSNMEFAQIRAIKTKYKRAGVFNDFLQVQTG